ncbi:MAG TPA: hypothetical protein VFD51_01865 [Patescibacteria group bacterium]|nr:hypothetical protein [Patescibacteria group bacterium]
MKKKFIFMFVIASIFLFGCNYVEVDFEESATVEEVPEAESNLILKSAQGFSSELGKVYVPQGVGVGLKVCGKTSPISSVLWKIEVSNYENDQISHKFNTLGEIDVEIYANFSDHTSETRKFKVYCVLDISTVDPVKVFITEGGNDNWNVLFLFSKERLRYATDNNYYYNGTVTDWTQKPVLAGDTNYIIDVNGNPQITTDIGKYVGVKMSLSARGLYNIALIHSGDNWTNLSGSSFIRSDNPGLVWFWFEDGKIIPQGDVIAYNLPGATGDNYFRFTQNGSSSTDKVTLYFKLVNDFTTNAFVLRQLSGGTYSEPITMWSVPDHQQWGQIELPSSELMDTVNSFRYGPNKNNPNIYSSNMEKSFFYDEYFKNIRLALYEF